MSDDTKTLFQDLLNQRITGRTGWHDEARFQPEVLQKGMLTLRITGFAADPMRVSDLLGLRPTRTAIVGQRRTRGNGRPCHFNGWWLEVRSQILKGRGVAHAEAIRDLIGLLRGREALFTRLWHELSPEEIVVYGSTEVPWDEQCGIWLDAADMLVLAACGINWGVDLHATDR